MDQNPTSTPFSVSAERIYSILATVFCCTIIVSNVLAIKPLELGPFALPASILTFPLLYIINDVLSDVFGFKRMRTIIIAGFFAAAAAALVFHLAIWFPGVNPEVNVTFASTLGSSFRILLGSFASYLLGSLLNSYLMSSLKKHFEKNLFFRCVSSTLVGETVDSCVFITIAFAGIYEPLFILTMIASQVLFKVAYEIVLYPVTKRVIYAVRARV